MGAAISDKIRELATTGRMAYYDRLAAEIPPTLVEIMHIPGVGPKTVKQLHEQLGIESLEDLKRAAEAGTLRDLRGMSSRTEQLVLEGIARLEANPRRLLLNRAEASIVGIAAALEALPGVRSVVPAGSFRRRKETIGDLDLLVETDAPGLVLDTFTGLGVVDQILEPRPVQGRGPPAARAAGRPHGHAARRGRHVPASISRARRSTTSSCAPVPAIAAGACPRRATCASTRTASR